MLMFTNRRDFHAVPNSGTKVIAAHPLFGHLHGKEDRE